MGGRGSSSGMSGSSMGKISSDSSNQRYDTWTNAREYARNNKVITEPNLTKPQRDMYIDMQDGNYSKLNSASVKTLTAVKEKAEYEYDQAQRYIAKGDYGADSDFVRDGKFKAGVNQRKTAARIRNEVTEELEKRGKRTGSREITSGTYQRAISRNTKQVNALFKNRK